MHNIHIRPASAADAAALLAIYAPYVKQTAITFEYEVPSEEEFRERIHRTLQSYPWLVAEKEGRLLGYAYAGPFHERAAYRWAVETSIYVDCSMKHQGIGRLLHEALETDLVRRGFQNMNACIAYISTADPRLPVDSIRFHEHMGYIRVAHFHQCGLKFGRWYDTVWMEKLIGNHEESVRRS